VQLIEKIRLEREYQIKQLVLLLSLISKENKITSKETEVEKCNHGLFRLIWLHYYHFYCIKCVLVFAKVYKLSNIEVSLFHILMKWIEKNSIEMKFKFKAQSILWLFILKIANNFIKRFDKRWYFDIESELSSALKMEIKQKSILRSIKYKIYFSITLMYSQSRL
jgi:hypothetical protein